METSRPLVGISCGYYSPWDMDVARENFGAMCGHGALAAAFGLEVCRVMQHFPHGGGWVNVPMMEAAIVRAGQVPRKLVSWCEKDAPSVSILQFHGPWMRDDVPIAARCRYRHWVASRGGFVWDCNSPSWQPRDAWEREVIPLLMPSRGTGYNVFRTFYWFPSK